MKKYGFVIGRCQPFHYGHQHIINEILLDNLIPIILLGDDNGLDKVRNPLSYEQRVELIKSVYPNTQIIFYKLEDKNNWNKWFDDIGHKVSGESERDVSEATFYYNHKPEDKYDFFECYGNEYINEYYTQIFIDHEVDVKQVSFASKDDIKIHATATNIRNDIDNLKHLLDARVYWKLKEWGW